MAERDELRLCPGHGEEHRQGAQGEGHGACAQGLVQEVKTDSRREKEFCLLVMTLWTS